MLDVLGDAMAEAFGVPRDHVAHNRPFRGGWITRGHGAGDLPWIQIEMNRVLHLTDPWFDESALAVSPERLGTLRDSFWPP